MPRPKRTKVASATTRVAKTSTTADPAPRKQQPKAKQTKEPEVVNNSFSEDSDGLVVKSHTTRPRRRMPWQKTPEPVDEAEMTMTGALPVEDKVTVASTKIQTPGSSTSKRLRTSKGSAKESSKKSTPATVASTQSRSFATNVQNMPAEEDDSTGFDGLLTFDSLDSESPARGTRPPSAIKVGATPAHETSILALTNFKRRARQPSLLRMVHQTTDVEDNDQDDSHDLSLNLDLSDELDDFHPDAESTPLNVRKNAQEPETNKHGRDSLSSTASRGTKRKLSPVIQVPRSSPPFDPPSGTDVEASRSPSPILPEVLESREVPEETVEQSEGEPDILSETLAPPRSSSSEREADDLPDSPVQMQPRRRARSTRQATRDEESEAEETETPAKPKGRTKKKAERSISTTQLKNLLPRRRTRKQQGQNDSDVESEGDMTVDSDQDELQLPPPRRGVASRKPVPTKVTKKSTRGQKKSATVTKAAQKNPKTYSRRTSSDKENEGANYSDEDVQEATESTVNSTIAVKPSKMAAIAKKFQDVDEFELEFETVDITTSSSPWR